MFDMRMKSMFFDRVAVIKAAGKARVKALSQGGAFIRTSARSSIRLGRKPSRPGSPPHSHTGLLRKILFAYDRSSQSVVVGPMKLNKPGMAPRALEVGGRSVSHRRRGTQAVSVPIIVDARPYMGPALQKELPKIPARWRNSVRP